MKKLILITLLSILIFGVLISCNPEEIPEVNVYSVNSYINYQNGKSAIIVVKNREKIFSTPKNQDNIARDFLIDEEDMYISGNFINSEYNSMACYWKNSERIPLAVPADAEGSSATSIFIYGEDIYISGYYIVGYDKNVACYWINGERYDIPDYGFDIESIAYAISVYNGEVYLAGEIYRYGYNVDDFNHGCYWINGDRHDLIENQDDVSNVSDIFIDDNNGDVYISGDFNNTACYWKNEVRHSLIGTSETTSIQYKDNSLYITGASCTDNNVIGVYWKDNEKIELSYGDNGSIAYSLSVYNESVYVSGTYSDAQYTFGGYWEKGKFVYITEGSFNANSFIYVEKNIIE
jgi:hypothetical protein